MTGADGSWGEPIAGKQVGSVAARGYRVARKWIGENELRWVSMRVYVDPATDLPVRMDHRGVCRCLGRATRLTKNRADVVNDAGCIGESIGVHSRAHSGWGMSNAWRTHVARPSTSRLRQLPVPRHGPLAPHV